MHIKSSEQTPKKDGKLIRSGVWFFYSMLLWSILVIPAVVALFFMFDLAPKLLENGTPEMSVSIGLIVGILISLGISYFYSRAAIKNVE
ncbi:MAG: hypothetical protein KAH57_03185 [Thermoplasmata archaeon]|nr:hypothetical protein [Thermoplasmata archaeon]